MSTALRKAGELQKAVWILTRQNREGVSRKEVKRRFLWMVKRARSWLEEGIGSPRQAMTLVFIRQRKSLNLFTLLAIGVKTVSGVQSPVQALKAFASETDSEVGVRMSFPICHSPMNPLSTANLGGRSMMARHT